MIRAIDVHKTFRGNHVLQGTNLHIKRGESMVVIGGSGCGKSVLMKHVMGLLRPDKGQVIIDDKDISTLKPKELNETRKNLACYFRVQPYLTP